MILHNTMHFGMKGFFRIRTINKFSGKCRIDTGWFPNTILNSGRNVMASRGDWMNCCQVGRNGVFNADILVRQSETSLAAYVDGTANIVETTNGQAASSPYFGWKRRTYRIAAGVIGGENLQEVGVGWSAAGGSTLISRAPILDPVLQVPTTVTPLVDEMLDVSYELRYYVPTEDILLPQVTLNGVVYNTITRAALATSDVWSDNIGAQIGAVKNYLHWTAWTGDIGTIVTSPSGTSAACDSSGQWDSAYSNNSYELQVNCPVGSIGWNIVGGIRSMMITTTAGAYQTQFNAVGTDNTIPKDTDHTMNMAWLLNWFEYT